MHIVLTVHQFFPEYQSGTEVLTFSTAKELLRRGHRVTVFTGYPARKPLPDGHRFDRYEIEGIEVHRFHHAYVPMGGQEVVSEMEYNNLLAARYFAGMLEELKPDLVHFFHFMRLGSGMVDAAVQAGIPAYYTPTDFWSVCATCQLLLPNGKMCGGPSSQAGNCVRHVATQTQWRYSSIASRMPVIAMDMAAALAKAGAPMPYGAEVAALSRRTPFNVARLNAMQRIFSPTNIMTSSLLKQGVRQDLIQQSAYGIEVAAYTQAKPRAAAAGPVRLGFIGTLQPHKGCHVLIDAFKKLPAGSAHLKIYGDLNHGPQYIAQLREAAGGRADIEFCGTFPNTEIGNVLADLDALVVPSVWYENAPLVVYSALAAYCPVVASNFPGMAEVVKDDVNGMLFKPSDSGDLARRLKTLVSDRAVLPRLSGNCRPPKSIATYVDELVGAYAQPRQPVSLPGAQRFEPFRPAMHGFVVGWVVPSQSAPVRVRVCEGERELAETSKFMARPDVQAGLRQSGVSIDSSRFGFLLDLRHTINQRVNTVLEVEDSKGARHAVPFESLKTGSSVQVGDVLVGWDQEETA